MKICRETGLRMSPHNPSVTPKSGNGSRKESNVIHLTLPKCIFKHFIQTENILRNAILRPFKNGVTEKSIFDPLPPSLLFTLCH